MNIVWCFHIVGFSLGPRWQLSMFLDFFPVLKALCVLGYGFLLQILNFLIILIILDIGTCLEMVPQLLMTFTYLFNISLSASEAIRL
jgi:hypothetical protein